MKTYRGDPGPPCVVLVWSDDMPDTPPWELNPTLSEQGFAWGQKVDTRGDQARLALAMLIDLLGDEKEAAKYNQRLKYRLLYPLKPEESWEITGAEILGHVEDMKRIARETAPLIKQMALEPAPVVNEGGQGIGISKEGRR